MWLLGICLFARDCPHVVPLVIDDRRLYLIGASLKDLGWKCFAFTQLDAGEIAGLKARI